MNESKRSSVAVAISLRQRILIGAAAAGLLSFSVVGCASAPPESNAPDDDWRLAPGQPEPESPVTAARRIAQAPTQEEREQLARDYRAENPVPENVRAAKMKSSLPAAGADPSIGRTSQALVSACNQVIEGCIDWGVYFDGLEMCWNYSTCTVNVCRGTYSCHYSWGDPPNL